MDISQTQPLNGDATQFALRVALQTMKDRCQALQKRINSLEDENQQLHTTATRTDGLKSTLPTASVGFAAENFQLRLQVADLQRQKTQFTEQINMVSSENRKLWSRLSQMAKDQNSKERDSDIILTHNNGTGAGANQNLIRSKTFTQHSPNPNLQKYKIVSNEGINDGNAVKDFSLEEVALNTGAGEEMANLSESDLGFSYLNMDESNLGQLSNVNEHAFELKMKKFSDGLQDLQREALEQQKELCKTLTALELRMAKPEFAQKKPEMADKSLETDESLSETLQATISNTPGAYNTAEKTDVANPRINFIQEKIDADAVVKTCPMCGKIYDDSVTFQAFCEHVESHFNTETSDFGSMNTEYDFECVSNTVGNF